jgi:hypothetical protein
MGNEFDYFAIGEMPQQEHVVFSPAEIKAEHDQGEPDREHQRVFEDETQHVKA